MRSLIHFLRAAGQDRQDLRLEDFSEQQVRWLIDSGLGSLLLRHLIDGPEARRSPLWPHIQGADLAARVASAELLDAMEEILRACEGRTRPPTLLKGISSCDQLYPEPHLRPMRDIDFLVTTDDLAATEATLHELGYRQESSRPREFYETHHHIMPFRHPRTGAWVEVHRGLSSTGSPAGSDALFSEAHVNAERCRSTFRGRAAYRLSVELQIVYLAAHWAYDFRPAGGVVTVLDAIHLLNTARAIRWAHVLELLEGAIAANAVYLLLAYLDGRELVELPRGLLAEIARRQKSFGRGSLHLLHAIIDRYVVNGSSQGLLMSERNIRIVWNSLLLPEPEIRKLVRVGWRLLPSRYWLMRSTPNEPSPNTIVPRTEPDAASNAESKSRS